jgi:hypothetical protein
MIPAASGIPGGVFHVDAQRLSPQEYDRVLEAMRTFFLSLDPESVTARTRGFASLMGPRPAGLASPDAPGAAPDTAPSVADATAPPAVTTGDTSVTVLRGETPDREGVETARSTLAAMRSRAERGIAVSRRRGAERESSVYDGDLFDELLDLRARAAGLPAGFVSALDEALTAVGRRPGAVLAQEVIDMTSKLSSTLSV